MSTVIEVLMRKAEPYKLTLSRGQKGTYGWEITVSAATFPEAHRIAEHADSDLRQKFGGKV